MCVRVRVCARECVCVIISFRVVVCAGTAISVYVCVHVCVFVVVLFRSVVYVGIAVCVRGGW